MARPAFFRGCAVYGSGRHALYVTDEEGLRALVDTLCESSVVAVDTEFMRERTYYARLCLIQLASPDIAAIVDPLAMEDLSPLAELMTNDSVTKILHAGSQDLEIFHRLLGVTAGPIFDTQVAATLAGFPQQVGYGPLVKEMLGVQLDKGDTYTDWAKRPLSDTQVEYALNDVRYLPEVHRQLTETLDREGRLEWLAPDFQRMTDPATYTCLPREQWKRIKRVSSLNRRQLAVAREVTAWRESEAQRRDTPRRWVLGDESIIEIARRSPGTPQELIAIRGVGDKVGRSVQKGLLDAVAAGLGVPDAELPKITRRHRPQGDVDGAVDLMVALVRLRAREHGVAMPLLASRDDLERLAAGEREESPLLEGWRRAMIGEELLAVLDGVLVMRVDNGALIVEAHDAKTPQE